MEIIKIKIINLLLLLVNLFVQSYYSVPISMDDIGKKCEFDERNIKSSNISAYMRISTLCRIYKFDVSTLEHLIQNIINLTNCEYDLKPNFRNIHWNVTTEDWDMEDNCSIVYVKTTEMSELEKLSGDLLHVCNDIDVILQFIFEINKKLNLFSESPIHNLHLVMSLEDVINDITNDSYEMDRTHMLPLLDFKGSALEHLERVNLQYQYKDSMINLRIDCPIFGKNPMNVYRTNDGYCLIHDDSFQLICYNEGDFNNKCSKISLYNNTYICERMNHSEDYKDASVVANDLTIVLIIFINIVILFVIIYVVTYIRKFQIGITIFLYQ